MTTRIITVTTPASDAQKQMTTLAAVKAELGIVDGSEDAALTSFIEQASQVITSECCRILASESVTETIYTDFWATTLRLSRYPVSAIASVSECGVALTAGDDFIVDTAAGAMLRVDASGRIVSWGVGKIVITYTAGYALEAETPSDLQRACLSLVKIMRSSASRDPFMKSEEIPGVRITDYWVGAIGNGALPADISGMLARYKRVPNGCM